jgi:hypothetical protein
MHRRTFVVTTDPGGDKPLVRRMSTAKTAPRLANQMNKALSDMGLVCLIGALLAIIHLFIMP